MNSYRKEIMHGLSFWIQSLWLDWSLYCIFQPYFQPSFLSFLCNTRVHYKRVSTWKVEDWTLYRVSQEKCARLWESVPYVKVHRYNPKHLYPKLNGYGDKGQRKVRSSCGSTYCTCSAEALRVHRNAQSAKLNQYFNTAGYSCAM